MKPDATNALPRRPSPGAAGARLGQLYEEHARMVYGVCRLILRDGDEAEDATQQVFLSAYRSLLSGTEPRNAGAWLGTIARNEARGRAATRAHRPVRLVDTASTTVSLEDQADARADAAQLRAHIAALPEKQREAIILRDLYGLRYDEVARALNTSRPAVEALLFRGRRRLQRHLRPEAAATAIVVPLALRESLAYAVPGFAAAGAPVGVLAKLAAVPVAAKLAAAGVTVGAVGSGVVAEERLRHGDPRPAPPALTVVEKRAPSFDPALARRAPVATAPVLATRRAAGDEDEREEPEHLDEREDEIADERDDEAEERDEREHGRAVAASQPPVEDDDRAGDSVDEPEADGREAEDAEESVDTDEVDSLDDDD